MHSANTNRIVYTLVFFFLVFSSTAQTLEAEFNSLLGSKGKLPFWLWANQLGRYDQNSSSVQNFEFVAGHQLRLGDSDFNVEGMANLTALLADENDFRFTELYGGINWRFLQLKGGAFAEQEVYHELSASNANLAISRNARPHPKIRAGFNRYVTLIPDWLSINGFYEEGWLNDERYVEDTHLHHKAFYLRLGNPNAIQFTAGLEHFVMWGGTHPVYGELEGWESYWDYIFGNGGGGNSLETDQANVLGNQYGAYQIELHKAWKEFDLSFYISHPFDDYSGLNWENHLDNLFGFFLNVKKETPLIKGMALEYYHTKNQSGTIHFIEADGNVIGHGQDNYFNNGVYQSGATYHQMTMTSPLFTPVRIEDGISRGIENNRFSGIHVGVNGFLSSQLSWKGMFTYTNNFGRYKGNYPNKVGDTYDPSRKQFSSMVQLEYLFAKFPLQVGTSLALDSGSLFDDGQETTRPGILFSITYLFLNE